jgi:hypothetical protein
MPVFPKIFPILAKKVSGKRMNGGFKEAAVFERWPIKKGDFKSPLLEAQWQLRITLEFD